MKISQVNDFKILYGQQTKMTIRFLKGELTIAEEITSPTPDKLVFLDLYNIFVKNNESNVFKWMRFGYEN